LKKIYKDQNISRYFKDDEKYLKDAFIFTESLWLKQLERIDKLNIIMVSESPFFGDSKIYIYNPNTPPSVFFYFRDIEIFLNEDEEIIKPKTTIEQKNMMYEYFRKNGFITLDLFPFALNPNHTKIDYRNITKSLYQELLEVTKKEYLIPKLNKCLEKSDKDTHFVYRYKRLFEKTENHFEKVLSNLTQTNYKIDSINGKGMHLDKGKLRSLLK
jgi:hypothetical protein